MQPLKAVGSQGSWFATVNGERVPCAWLWWLHGYHYHDTEIETDNPKWPEYIAAIKEGKKVAFTGKKEKNGKWQRDGYVAMYSVRNIVVTAEALDFDLIPETKIPLE